MRSTVDNAGGIVIPKPLLDELGWHPGQDLELAVVDGRLTIDVPPAEMHLENQGHGIVGVTGQAMPSLPTELVRDVLEKIRR
jgi:AbrB family looped-hinge helix DNA binding protein